MNAPLSKMVFSVCFALAWPLASGCKSDSDGAAPGGSTSPYSGQTPIDVVPSLSAEVRSDDPMADALRQAGDAMKLVEKAKQRMNETPPGGSAAPSQTPPSPSSSSAPAPSAPDATTSAPKSDAPAN